MTVPVLREELARADRRYHDLLKQVKNALVHEDCRVSSDQKARLQKVLQDHIDLKVVYEFRHKLQELWAKKHTTLV